MVGVILVPKALLTELDTRVGVGRGATRGVGAARRAGWQP